MAIPLLLYSCIGAVISPFLSCSVGSHISDNRASARRITLLSIILSLIVLSCDGNRLTSIRNRTLQLASCQTVEFQLVRGESDGSQFYTGKIEKTLEGYTIHYEEPEMASVELEQPGLLVPLMNDAAGTAVEWSWLKLYCPGSTDPVFDSDRMETSANTCYWERKGFHVTLLEPEKTLSDPEFCCEPLKPCK